VDDPLSNLKGRGLEFTSKVSFLKNSLKATAATPYLTMNNPTLGI
jgi:hypothetical protein